MAHDAVDILWEGQAGHKHVMTIGNSGSQHRGECSWWAQGPGCLEKIQEWQQWVQHCHLSSDSEASECITFADGKLSVRVEGGQQLLTLAMDNGNFLETKTDESFRVEPKAQELPQHAQEKPEDKPRKACPFTESKTWHGLPGVLEAVYVQVNRPLDWEALALITQDSGRGSINGNTAGEPGVQMTEYALNPKGLPPKERPPGTMLSIATKKVILGQGPWCDEELTMAWERNMQTEGLSQHVCCQTMTYEWRDNDGVTHVTAWSKSVRNAMLRGGAEYQRQRALNRAADNWNKTFMLSTNSGLQRIKQAANTRAQGDLMDSTRWGWRCMLQLQETDSWKKPATTTWAAEFLLREGESREFLGSWLHSSTVH
jgi:hypothetical protein